VTRHKSDNMCRVEATDWRHATTKSKTKIQMWAHCCANTNDVWSV